MHWDCNGKNTPTKEEETEREKKLNQRFTVQDKEEEDGVKDSGSAKRERALRKYFNGQHQRRGRRRSEHQILCWNSNDSVKPKRIGEQNAVNPQRNQ